LLCGALSDKKISWLRILQANGGLDLVQRAGTMIRGDSLELLAVRIAAVKFVEAACRISRPADDGSAGEHVVYERTGWGAIQQAGTGLGLQTYNHDPNVYRQTPRSSRLSRRRMASLFSCTGKAESSQKTGSWKTLLLRLMRSTRNKIHFVKSLQVSQSVILNRLLD
jgi:hypothetical protein